MKSSAHSRVPSNVHGNAPVGFMSFPIAMGCCGTAGPCGGPPGPCRPPGPPGPPPKNPPPPPG
jgi:hypothetical protein